MIRAARRRSVAQGRASGAGEVVCEALDANGWGELMSRPTKKKKRVARKADSRRHPASRRSKRRRSAATKFTPAEEKVIDEHLQRYIDAERDFLIKVWHLEEKP